MAVEFSWGETSLSYAFIMYLLVSVSLGLYLIKYMYTLNKPISAMIVLILLILVFTFFGKRWFQYGQLKGTTAWVQANAGVQSGSSGSASQCAGTSSTSGPTSWPPVVNYCPDFMTIDGSGKCVDSNKLYGTTNLGKTEIAKYTGNSNVCPSVTDSTKSMYLRWEGVVQAEGSCSPGNIGKLPSN
jgi:hypothetical protein